MIVYDLLCENAHRFEGWFASAEAFSHQHEAGHLSCPMCGSSSVHKQLSAPYVQTTGASSEPREHTVMANPGLMEDVRKKLVEVVLQNTEDVGTRFSQEARAIHNKKAPDRAIRGLATSAQAKELRDEGIDVFSLPTPAVPKDKLH
jgi:hypothetical protein